jgi:hypothetical protein
MRRALHNGMKLHPDAAPEEIARQVRLLADEHIDDVLRRIGQLTPTRESHTTLFILGNVATGHWRSPSSIHF